MADTELIAETNCLLRTVLEHDAEQREESEKRRSELKLDLGEISAKGQEKMKERLREKGLPEEAVKGTEEDWEARHKEAQRKSQENIEAARMRHERYQDELLSELRTQSDLLRQIAGALQK